jgi:hypothetical protein
LDREACTELEPDTQVAGVAGSLVAVAVDTVLAEELEVENTPQSVAEEGTQELGAENKTQAVAEGTQADASNNEVSAEGHTWLEQYILRRTVELENTEQCYSHSWAVLELCSTLPVVDSGGNSFHFPVLPM